MERWACVDVPYLALQMLLDQHPDWRPYPVAVVDHDTAQGVILQCNKLARDFQIKPGLRYAAALSLSQDLRAAVVDAKKITGEVTRLVDDLREFSPHVESDPNQAGLFWLRATGLDRLFKGFDVWARALFEHLREHGIYASITVGWTRFGTFAIARSEPVGWRILSTYDQERKAQGDVRLDLLGLPPKIIAKLDKLAIHTIDELLALPPSGVRKRFGIEAADLWRFGHGGGELPLQPLAWDQPVQAVFDLDDAMWDMTQLTFLIKSTLHPLVLDLAGRHQDLRDLTIHLFLEDGDVHDVQIKPATPTLDEVRVVELCRLRLERLKLPAAIVRVEIEVHGVSIHRDQSHLFHDNARRDLQVANHALARLKAEHPDAVCRVVQHDRHLPEAKFSLEPLEALRRANPTPTCRTTLIRRVLDRPQPLHRFRPDIGMGWLIRDLDEGVVTQAFGPNKVSGGWWLDGERAVHHLLARRFADTSTHHVSPRARYFERDGAFVDPQEPNNDPPPDDAQHPGISRAYWYTETTRGDLYWVYWDYRRQQWFLHGVVE